MFDPFPEPTLEADHPFFFVLAKMEPKKIIRPLFIGRMQGHSQQTLGTHVLQSSCRAVTEVCAVP